MVLEPLSWTKDTVSILQCADNEKMSTSDEEGRDLIRGDLNSEARPSRAELLFKLGLVS